MDKTKVLCVRCGKAVEENRNLFDTFEKMHWLCFHLEFEHEGDPDKSCGDPSCPWWHIDVYRRELERLGKNPQAIIDSAISERWELKT